MAAPIEFKWAYVEAALFISVSDEPGGITDDFTDDDFAPETLKAMHADCDAFYDANALDIEDNDKRAGHDFWLTRCGHGAGFWDGDWEEPMASRLTAAAEAFGNKDLYVGNDGMIYQA